MSRVITCDQCGKETSPAIEVKQDIIGNKHLDFCSWKCLRDYAVATQEELEKRAKLPGPRSFAEAMKHRKMMEWKKRIEEYDAEGRKPTNFTSAMYHATIERMRKEVAEWEKLMAERQKEWEEWKKQKENETDGN